MLNRNQLELGLERTSSKRIRYSGSTRRARATWWFSRMREAVSNAREFPFTPTESLGDCPSDLSRTR